jgi:hypothetical protein
MELKLHIRRIRSHGQGELLRGLVPLPFLAKAVIGTARMLRAKTKDISVRIRLLFLMAFS